MFVKAIALALGASPLASAAAATVIGSQCAANNCLRALRASARLEQAQSDCNSWIATTVTPPVVTETSWSTVDLIETVVTSITVDNTIELTATVTSSVIATTTAFVTSTVLVPLAGAQKRAADTITVIGGTTAIPTYASACSGEVRYSSACSCISASPITVTAVASTTTTTIPTTIWHTESQTSLTTTDVPITVATATTTTTISTSTVSSVVATVTMTPFKLTISDGYGTFYLFREGFYSDILNLTKDPAKASTLYLRTDGRVFNEKNESFFRYTNPGQRQYGRFMDERWMSMSFSTIFTCTINAGDFRCAIPGTSANQWGTELFQVGNNWERWENTGLLHGSADQFTASHSIVNVRAIPA